jgi:hypothetical protein
MNRHPAASELRELVLRTLDAREEEQALLEHLSRCDECFQVYEDLWAEASGDLPDLNYVFLDSSGGRRLEERLFHRIHVASLGTASGWLVTEGFLHVVVGVLLPIVSFDRAPTSRARGDKP